MYFCPSCSSIRSMGDKYRKLNVSREKKKGIIAKSRWILKSEYNYWSCTPSSYCRGCCFDGKLPNVDIYKVPVIRKLSQISFDDHFTNLDGARSALRNEKMLGYPLTKLPIFLVLTYSL